MTSENARTLDPADAYDTGSSEIIFQIYDTLVTFRGNDTKRFILVLLQAGQYQMTH